MQAGKSSSSDPVKIQIGEAWGVRPVTNSFFLILSLGHLGHLNCFRYGAPSHVQEYKEVRFNLSVDWFELIKSGKKSCEMRANSPWWASRLQGITHCSFARAYSKCVLPVKKVHSLSMISAAEVPQHGGPQPGSPAFSSLFKDSDEIFLIKFDPYSEEEIADMPDKKSQGALKALKENAGEHNLQDEEVMDAKELFRPKADRPARNPHYHQEMKLKEIQMPQCVELICPGCVVRFRGE